MEDQLIVNVILLLHANKVIFFHLHFIILVIIIVIFFLKKLVDKKNDKEKIKIFPETNEEYISVKYGCIKFIDCYRLLSDSLDKLVKTLDNDDFVILKKEFPDKWQYLNKKLSYPYENFNNIDDYQKSFNIFLKKDFFSKLKIGYPDDSDVERTRETFKVFNTKNGEEESKLYLKSDFILLADNFAKFMKVSNKEFEINPLYRVSLPG